MQGRKRGCVTRTPVTCLLLLPFLTADRRQRSKMPTHTDSAWAPRRPFPPSLSSTSGAWGSLQCVLFRFLSVCVSLSHLLLHRSFQRPKCLTPTPTPSPRKPAPPEPGFSSSKHTKRDRPLGALAWLRVWTQLPQSLPLSVTGSVGRGPGRHECCHCVTHPLGTGPWATWRGVNTLCPSLWRSQSVRERHTENRS